MFTNLLELESLAAAHLEKSVFDYIAGGANDELTLRENRAAFDRVKLLPRGLVDVSQRDMKVALLDQIYLAPLLVAPMAMIRLVHPDGELAVARAAASVGIPMIVSTWSTTRLDEIASMGAALWFQLYLYKDRAVTEHLIQQATAAGCRAIVLTIDVPVAGRRERDIRNRFQLPPAIQFANLPDVQAADVDADGSAIAAYATSQVDPSLNMEHVRWLRSITELPLLVKGIMHADDAYAASAECDGQIISNHGGRQLDSAPAALDVLPKLAHWSNVTLMDSGIRRGTDIMKALALGAKAVLVGRPVLYGLALEGEAGVRRVLELLIDELDTGMALCGCPSLGEINAEILHKP